MSAGGLKGIVGRLEVLEARAAAVSAPRQIVINFVAPDGNVSGVAVFAPKGLRVIVFDLVPPTPGEERRRASAIRVPLYPDEADNERVLQAAYDAAAKHDIDVSTAVVFPQCANVDEWESVARAQQQTLKDSVRD